MVTGRLKFAAGTVVRIGNKRVRLTRDVHEGDWIGAGRVVSGDYFSDCWLVSKMERVETEHRG